MIIILLLITVMTSSHVTLHGSYLDVKIKGRLGDVSWHLFLPTPWIDVVFTTQKYRRRYISLQSNAMLGRRWLEVREHNGSVTASERIELQDNWMVAERMSKGNKRCVTDVSLPMTCNTRDVPCVLFKDCDQRNHCYYIHISTAPREN